MIVLLSAWERNNAQLERVKIMPMGNWSKNTYVSLKVIQDVKIGIKQIEIFRE